MGDKQSGKPMDQHQKPADKQQESPQGFQLPVVTQFNDFLKHQKDQNGDQGNTKLPEPKVTDIVSHTTDKQGYDHYLHRDGSNEIVLPNGDSCRTYKDGSAEYRNHDGTSRIADRYGKGSNVYFNAEGKPTEIVYPNKGHAEITYGKDGNPSKVETWSHDKGHEIRERTHCHLGDPWKAEWKVTTEDTKGHVETHTGQSAVFVDKNDGEIQHYDRNKDGSWSHDRHTADGKSTHKDKDVAPGTVPKWSYETDQSAYVVNEKEQPVHEVKGQSHTHKHKHHKK